MGCHNFFDLPLQHNVYVFLSKVYISHKHQQATFGITSLQHSLSDRTGQEGFLQHHKRDGWAGRNDCLARYGKDNPVRPAAGRPRRVSICQGDIKRFIARVHGELLRVVPEGNGYTASDVACFVGEQPGTRWDGRRSTGARVQQVQTFFGRGGSVSSAGERGRDHNSKPRCFEVLAGGRGHGESAERRCSVSESPMRTCRTRCNWLIPECSLESVEADACTTWVFTCRNGIARACTAGLRRTNKHSNPRPGGNPEAKR